MSGPIAGDAGGQLVNRIRPLPEGRDALEKLYEDVRAFLVAIDPSYDPDPRARMALPPRGGASMFFRNLAKVGELVGVYPQIWDYVAWPFAWPRADNPEQAYRNSEAAKREWTGGRRLQHDELDLRLAPETIRIAQELGQELRMKLAALPPPEDEDEFLVDMDQMAALAKMRKDTLERKEGRPEPARRRGPRRANYYRWSEVHPWLEQVSGLRIPRKFSVNPFLECGGAEESDSKNLETD